MKQSILFGNSICAMVSAKWALDLGWSQFRQMLLLFAGLLFGPITLLVLYVYLVIQAQQQGRRGAQWFRDESHTVPRGEGAGK